MFVSTCASYPGPLALWSSSLGPAGGPGGSSTPMPPAADLYPGAVRPVLDMLAADNAKAGARAAASVSSLAPSFLITDILYPSVIPLPGTLPQTPGHTGVGRVEVGAGRVTPPRQGGGGSSTRTHHQQQQVKSEQLKFGIDRILQETIPRKHKSEPRADTSLSSSPLSGSLPPVAPKGSAGQQYMCGAPACSLVYPTPSYLTGSSSAIGIQPPSHPTSALPPDFSGAMMRPSHYPGPFAILSTEAVHHHLGRPHHHTAHTLPHPHPNQAFSQSTAPTPHHHHHHHHHQQQQPQNHPAKRKRSWSRAVFSNLQRKGLEKRFEVQKYVTKPDRRQVAAMLGLTDAQVKVWFQNRRMKWRHQEEAKHKREEEDKRKRQTEVDGDKIDEDKVQYKNQRPSKIENADSNPMETEFRCASTHNEVVSAEDSSDFQSEESELEDNDTIVIDCTEHDASDIYRRLDVSQKTS